MLLVNPALPVKDLKDLIALAKARPGQLAYGSSGIGSSSHLGFELLNSMAGIKTIHVPYKGLAPATEDTIGGHIAMTWDSITASAQHIRTNRIRAIGIGSLARSPLMPEIPTISESGLAGFELGSWYGLFAPPGTPAGVIIRLNREIAKALGDAAMRRQFATMGAEPVSGSPEDFRKVLRQDLAKWSKVARDAGVKAE